MPLSTRWRAWVRALCLPCTPRILETRTRTCHPPCRPYVVKVKYDTSHLLLLAPVMPLNVPELTIASLSCVDKTGNEKSRELYAQPAIVGRIVPASMQCGLLRSNVHFGALVHSFVRLSGHSAAGSAYRGYVTAKAMKSAHSQPCKPLSTRMCSSMKRLMRSMLNRIPRKSHMPSHSKAFLSRSTSMLFVSTLVPLAESYSTDRIILTHFIYFCNLSGTKIAGSMALDRLITGRIPAR